MSSPKSTYQRPIPTITPTKPSLSYPQTDKSVQQTHPHASPQKHPGSSRPTHSDNKPPPSSSQSCHSSQLSSPKSSSKSSSFSSPKIPPPQGSLKDCNVGSATHPKRTTSGKNVPQRQETQCKSMGKSTTSGDILPQRTKSGRVVRRPGRFRD